MIIPALIGGIASLASAGLGALSNKQTNAANAQAVADTNATNLQIANNTNAMNQAINERNIELTREQNAINRAREDNAVQRRAQDLMAAGLSKTLAAGSPASANAMQAPQATESMVTGHAMQAARSKAYSFDNVATAGKLVQEGLIANKELEAKNRELDIREQELDELHRHNIETEFTASRSVDVDERYLDQQDKWNQMYYDQNSEFHVDAVKLEDARNRISYLQYLSQDTQREMQNLWYQSEIDFRKTTTEQNAIRLTAEVAESTARCASYYADVELTGQQIDYIKAQIPYVAALTAEAYARKKNFDQDTANLLADTLIKVWNLSVAKGDGGKTTDPTVTSSVATEHRHERLNTHLSNITKGIGLGAAFAFGRGGGNYLQKVLGMDDWDPFGMRSLK